MDGVLSSHEKSIKGWKFWAWLTIGAMPMLHPQPAGFEYYSSYSTSPRTVNQDGRVIGSRQ
jgi:hypothetical protein